MLQNPYITYNEIAASLGNKVSWNYIQGIANGYNWIHISSKYKIPPRSHVICSKGAENYAVVLTNDDIHYICERLLNPKITYVEIAEELDYKVAPTTICRIANGKIWAHITNSYSIPKRSR